MGQSLETGIYDQLAMLINIDRTHWVCAVLDFRGRTIHYGNSQKSSIPVSISKTLSWWTHFHSGEVFTYQPLAITAQIDTHSCGVLALNALRHHLLNGESLISAQDALNGRLQILLEVLRHHRKVRNICIGRSNIVSHSCTRWSQTTHCKLKVMTLATAISQMVDLATFPTLQQTVSTPILSVTPRLPPNQPVPTNLSLPFCQQCVRA